LPAVIIRPFNNYGPFQHLEKAIPNFIVSALQDQPLTIHGDGQSSRDWMYVEDTCEALDKVLHAERDRVIGQTINLGTGTDTSVVEIARKILKALNKPESLLQFIEDRPGQVTRHISSTQKAHACLEWKSKIDLDEGLDRTIEFYRNNRQWWERGMKELWLPGTKG
jgi:dTDP-glucose 4,6-dehydratase